MRKESNNESGMVLVSVIIIGAILVILGFTMITTGTIEVKSANYFEDKTQAYYVAKTAADMIAEGIVSKNIVISAYPATFTGNIEQNPYTVDVREDNNVLVINAIAYSNGVKDQVKLRLTKNVKESPSYNFKVALFSDGLIDLFGGAQINGDIASNTTDEASISLSGGASINGTIYVGAGGIVDKILNIPNWMAKPKTLTLDESIHYPSPILPIVPTGIEMANDDYNGSRFVSGIKDGIMQVSGDTDYSITMSKDMYFRRINLYEDNNITINVGGENRIIVVDTFDASNGDVFIKGSGTLTVYVTDKFILGSSSLNWDGPERDPNKLNFYYYGSDGTSFSSSSKFCRIFYSNTSPFSLSGGGNFYGNIISATIQPISVSGGHNAYTNVIYVPNAAVDLSGGGNFKGTIIAKSITASGGATVTFNDAGIIKIPIASGGEETTTYEKTHYE